MTIKEDLIQAVREAFITALSLTDGQVIVSNSDGARPPLPYLSVAVTVHDTRVDTLTDWTIHGDNVGTPTQATRGPRQATCEVTAYGATALGWLEDITDHIDRSVVLIDQLRAAGVVVRGYGQVADVSLLLDTSTEARGIRVFTLAYERLGTAFDGVEFQYGELDTTLTSTVGPGSVTLTVLDPDDPFC